MNPPTQISSAIVSMMVSVIGLFLVDEGGENFAVLLESGVVGFDQAHHSLDAIQQVVAVAFQRFNAFHGAHFSSRRCAVRDHRCSSSKTRKNAETVAPVAPRPAAIETKENQIPLGISQL
jgi:hypothetical protein